jgi:site-specific DNA-methyltransferase (adenine-specific)
VDPYYADDSVTLYHGDCREITDWLSADVLVTDPPYGMAYESKHNRDRRNLKKGRSIAGDHTPELRDLALSLWGPRPAVIFGTWRIPRPAAVRALLIWHKRGAGGLGDLSLPWLSTHEEIYILGNGFVGRRSDSVLPVPPLNSGDSERPDHPTPKPVPLMELLLTKCPPGVIADPFAGSGSTLVAARNLGRTAIGVEIEERYCEIAARRLAQDVLPLETRG